MRWLALICLWAGQITLMQPAWGWFGGSTGQVIPFTTLADERQAVLDGLPCKWLAMDTPVQGERIDLVCKGGEWGTVTLMLDGAGLPDSLGRVVLIYRAMDPDQQLGAAEAFMAQRFLTHVVARLVPANVSGKVLESFWQTSSRAWDADGVRIAYTFEKKPGYGLQRLEIKGAARTLALPARSTPVASVTATVTVAKPSPTTSATTALPQGSGLLRQPVARPVTAPATSPRPTMPSVVLPRPVSATVSPPTNPANVSITAPLNLPSTLLQQASGTVRLGTAPAPESKVSPTPPIMPPSTLLPSGSSAGRPAAPSNFAAYNKAEALTRDVEEKALGQRNQPKITVQQASPTQPASSLPAVPTPSAQPTPQTQSDHGEGLGISGGPSPSRVTDPRFAPQRPLPQLEFIPKAEPVPSQGQIIRFEDEESQL
jgi:hypothetical protein